MISWYFLTYFFEAVKELHKFRFRSTTTFADTKIPLTQHIEHLNMDKYRGSDNRGEVDLDSDVNSLASGNIRQYNTVPGQCERLP